MSYGGFLYGKSLFGVFSEDLDIPIDSYLPDLMAYLPAYLQEIKEVQVTEKAIETEIGYQKYYTKDLLDQFFVETAAWGLAIWEQERGIVVDPFKSYPWRREVILAKIRGNGTTTKQMIVNAAAAFSGGEVAVNEYPSENRFVVQFIGVLGVPANMSGFIDMLENIKPAHLAYTFVFTYTSWNMLVADTWGSLSSKTWSQLRTYGGA